MKELKKVKAEKTVKPVRDILFDLRKQQARSPSTTANFSDLSIEWFFPSDFALSSELLTDLGFPNLLGVSQNIKIIVPSNNVGTPPDIRSNS